MTDDDAVFRKTYAAFLFDMDGTLLSSIAAAERVWAAWADRHGLEGIDIDAEVGWVHQGELDDVEGVHAIDGIVDFLNALPGDRWAIVTSATKQLAGRRLKAAGITPPKTFITAEDVKRGKPAPDCFLLAAERLGVKASDCLIFEDAPAGIAAAEAAGADVMVITATHDGHYETSHAKTGNYVDIIISTRDDGLLSVERRHA